MINPINLPSPAIDHHKVIICWAHNVDHLKNGPISQYIVLLWSMSNFNIQMSYTIGRIIRILHVTSVIATKTYVLSCATN